MDIVFVFKFEVCVDKIVVIIIDVLGEKMNILKVEFGSQVWGLICQLCDDKLVCGVVFIFVKVDNFIVGVDINMIVCCCSVQEVEVLVCQGQQIMVEIYGLLILVIVVIYGVCFGGGLELVLVCYGCICSDDEKI